MIYFLINNNYHLDLDLKLSKQLTDSELGLIQIPYSLNVIKKSEIFSRILNFAEKIVPSIAGFIIHPSRISSIQQDVDNNLKPTNSDILLVHTDMDLLNQYVIQKFYEAGCRVFLLEDGTSTMCTYNLVPEKAPLKDRIKTIILKKLYKFEYTSIEKYGKQILPVMNDSVFSGVIVNYGSSILRDIPLFKLTQVMDPVNIRYPLGAIFFSQPLYLWYISEDDFIRYLSDLLVISENFDHFFFKFHPSDNEYVKKGVKKLINEKFNKITIIEENDIAELLINKYPVRFAVTFNSTSALNLINRGVTPFFLNNLFNKAFPDPTLEAFDSFLKSIGCNVPAALNDVRPGFKAFSDIADSSGTESLREILN